MKARISRKRKFTEDQLLVKFQNNCWYHETAPPGKKYTIRVGSRFLYSDDTQQLFEMYREKMLSH